VNTDATGIRQRGLSLNTREGPYIIISRPKRVLLVEPAYKVKYPPLGLMKISTYHKSRDDEVVFYKGTSAAVRDQNWDIIYITTMFTFQWKRTIETIQFYQRGKQKNRKNIKVGGILGSLCRRTSRMKQA
jgi:hypothetical protein